MLFRSAAAFAACLTLLVACGTNDLAEPPVALGDFALGLNIVVADNVQKVPISRNATPDEWEAAVKKAVADRFGRYQGTRLYNIGISVDGYALAPPGIPVVAAPKSILVVTANIWDDAAGKKLNPEGKQLTVFESLSGDTVIGSGLTRTKAQQMEALSYNAVKSVERWLLENPEWFGLPPNIKVPATAVPTVVSPKAPVAATVPLSATASAPLSATVPVAPGTVPAAPAPVVTTTPLPAN
ncbi:MAG: hypothetical protein V4712_09865 [Pseudomonadota bacterium]